MKIDRKIPERNKTAPHADCLCLVCVFLRRPASTPVRPGSDEWDEALAACGVRSGEDEP